MKLPSLDFISFADLGKLFNAESTSIFRLESLPVYSVEYERRTFERFRSGEVPFESDDMREWGNTVSAAKSRGVTFERVRIVRLPVNEYLHFETSWGYRYSTAAGEEIRVIETETAADFQTEVPYLMDYWLLGDAGCHLMLYDLLGRFLGIAGLPKNMASPYDQLKKELLERSIPISQSALAKHL